MTHGLLAKYAYILLIQCLLKILTPFFVFFAVNVYRQKPYLPKLLILNMVRMNAADECLRKLPKITFYFSAAAIQIQTIADCLIGLF